MEGPLARPNVLERAGGLLGLREEFSNGDAKQGAGLQNPDSSNPEGKVFLISPVNEPVESWVVEYPPPAAEFRRLCFHTLVTYIQPVF